MSDFQYRNPDRKPNLPLFPWLDEHVDFLKKRWANGDSAALIASELSKMAGQSLTRNAVIGKGHRLGLSERKTKTRTPYPQRAVRTRLPRHAGASRRISKLKTVVTIMGPLPLPPQADDDVALISYAAFVDPAAKVEIGRNACHWPIGEPMNGFCGCEKVEGLPYCEKHAARAFNPARVEPRAYPTANIGMRAIKAAEEFVA